MNESSDAQLEQQTQPAANPREPVVAAPDAPILHDIETATETMALYTAIIGKRPQIVDPATEAFLSADEGPPPILTISPSWPQVNRQMISIWFRRMSNTARKRIDEALMRIAG